MACRSFFSQFLNVKVISSWNDQAPLLDIWMLHRHRGHWDGWAWWRKYIVKLINLGNKYWHEQQHCPCGYDIFQTLKLWTNGIEQKYWHQRWHCKWIQIWILSWPQNEDGLKNWSSPQNWRQNQKLRWPIKLRGPLEWRRHQKWRRPQK